MLDDPCTRFNNITQRVFRGYITPVVYVWETNDPENPWRAEARLLNANNLTVAKFAQSSATRKQRAKDLAAHTAYQWLHALYP
ncbi:hypothetical protein EST38_g7181 [Candolleomyces aberdarensis]|uniref:DRBM domain-containing protein n=1 Tax=Candolleomyces aberdarensis TaxID=2316362 RepID=A0A4Q2DIN1_9AGAR|nr:hypothetical protein EST38_g7181 [Candolleomyces aberdarensis]